MFNKRQGSETIASLLVTMNDSRSPMAGQNFYHSVLDIGDTEDQPGAELNAAWYLRNAKIFGG